MSVTLNPSTNPLTQCSIMSSDVLPQNISKSRSVEIRVSTFFIALEFDWYLGSSVADMSVKFQSDMIIITSDLAASRFSGKTSYCLMNRGRTRFNAARDTNSNNPGVVDLYSLKNQFCLSLDTGKLVFYHFLLTLPMSVSGFVRAKHFIAFLPTTSNEPGVLRSQDIVNIWQGNADIHWCFTVPDRSCGWEVNMWVNTCTISWDYYIRIVVSDIYVEAHLIWPQNKR